MNGPEMFTADQISWVTARDHRVQPIGRIGVPREQTNGRLRQVDGWWINWSQVAVDIHGESGVLAMPAVLLSVPDYPSEDAVTLVLGLGDAKRVASEILKAAAEAERKLHRVATGKKQRLERERREKTVRKEIPEETRCSHQGCGRSRAFFDEEGNGYCKRHAEELGIRPHGKVN